MRSILLIHKPHYRQRSQACKAGTGITVDVSSEERTSDLPGQWKHVTWDDDQLHDLVGESQNQLRGDALTGRVLSLYHSKRELTGRLMPVAEKSVPVRWRWISGTNNWSHSRHECKECPSDLLVRWITWLTSWPSRWITWPASWIGRKDTRLADWIWRQRSRSFLLAGWLML